MLYLNNVSEDFSSFYESKSHNETIDNACLMCTCNCACDCSCDCHCSCDCPNP